MDVQFYFRSKRFSLHLLEKSQILILTFQYDNKVMGTKYYHLLKQNKDVKRKTSAVKIEFKPRRSPPNFV